MSDRSRTDTSTAAGGTAPWFRVERLGHVNLYISDYERTLAFYRDVLGLWDGWTRPQIGGGFLNNGASHHDVGFLPWDSGERREHASGPGLNHLAFEVPTEKQLVEGYRRARDDGFEFLAEADHVITKSLYCHDPAGTQLELYADSKISFRDPDFMEMRRATTQWDASDTLAAEDTPFGVSEHLPVKAEGTIFHAAKITGATLDVPDLADAADFYRRALGLESADAGDGWVVLSGAAGGRDLVLWAADAGDASASALHHVSFAALDEADLNDSLVRARAAGIEILEDFDTPFQRAVVIADPDGNLVKIFAERSAIGDAAALPPAELKWLL